MLENSEYPFKGWVDKINGYGVLFRFILPLAVLVFGSIFSGKLDDLKAGQLKLDDHFANHLTHHQDLEVGYEKRLSVLETKVK